MSFGLGGNSGGSLFRFRQRTHQAVIPENAVPTSSSSGSPNHYDPTEVDGCLVIDKREDARIQSRARFERPM